MDSFGAKKSPLMTADATAACHVERRETFLANVLWRHSENPKFFSRDCGIRMTTL
jgi:hypothetical protein